MWETRWIILTEGLLRPVMYVCITGLYTFCIIFMYVCNTASLDVESDPSNHYTDPSLYLTMSFMSRNLNQRIFDFRKMCYSLTKANSTCLVQMANLMYGEEDNDIKYKAYNVYFIIVHMLWIYLFSIQT